MARTLQLAATCLATLAVHGALMAAPKKVSDRHQFGVIGHSFHSGGGEARLKQSIADESEAALEFVVVTGIKGAAESCSDRLYEKRRDIFDDAKRPIIVAPAASDWSDCKNSAGRSVAIERLNRLREVFFSEPASLGARKMPLTRLSSSPRFRSYAENAHWQVGDVLYATINLPSNNNHYRPEAGRNSEYEDRLVANRFWLKRLFSIAKREKLDAIVLFSEGDLKALTQPTGLQALLGRGSSKLDGFDEPRRQIAMLAQKYPGKVLLIDTDSTRKDAQPTIEWRGNLGHLNLGSEAVEVKVTPGTASLFTLKNAGDEK
jgi:hypothetical protein